MIDIREYQCEVCGRRYDTPERALACETQPRWQETAPPRGMVHGNALGASHHDRNMTFAVAEIVPSNSNPHLYTVAKWACRDTGMGDTLGAEQCGSGSLHSGRALWRPDAPAPRHPTFKRLVAWLEGEGIPVTCADGEGGWLSLKDFLYLHSEATP